jgi:dTDP-glucose 4,6-dehydratase
VGACRAAALEGRDPVTDRYLVIGSNSFSGAHFVSHLLQRGSAVAGVSRSPEPHPAYLPYRWRPHAGSFSFHQLDLNRDLPAIVQVARDFKPAYVVNFAAQGMVAQSWARPTDWFQTNVVGHVGLHDELRKLPGLVKYVHVGTPEVYGTCEGSIAEDEPFRPSTPYAVSRAACDLSLRTFVKAYGFPVVTTRAANVYGPGQRLYRIIPRTILSIRLGQRVPLHGGGTSVRSFIHIGDVAEGTRRAAEKGKPGECFHLSTAESVSIRGLVERICRRMGVDFDEAVEVVGERLGKDHAYLLDTSKAKVRLDWSPSVSLDDGIEQTLAWVDRHLATLKTEPLEYVHQA